MDKQTFFFVRSDIVVIDRDPEMADMDNPNGEIYGYAAYVIVEEPDGSRLRHFESFVGRCESTQELRAERFLARIHASGRTPDFKKYWFGIEAAYGSPAWEEQKSYESWANELGE